MFEPIDEKYFKWLCAKVLDINTRNHHDLMRILHKTAFEPMPNIICDANRAEDGKDLRDDWQISVKETFDREWRNLPASVLEVFIAFAQHASFQTDMPVRYWFWRFMENLDLDEYRQVYEEDIPVIEDILATFIYRTYKPNGHGGMFPMRSTQNDQRQVEIWYQFCEYLEDQGMI